MRGFIRRAHRPQHVVLPLADICHPAGQMCAAGSVPGRPPGRGVREAGCWLRIPPQEPHGACPPACDPLPGPEVSTGAGLGDAAAHPDPRSQIPEGEPVFPESAVQGVSAGWHGAPASPQRDRPKRHSLDASQGSALPPGPSRARSATPTLPARCRGRILATDPWHQVTGPFTKYSSFSCI